MRRQELFNYTRDLYLQIWVRNEGENGEEVTDQTYEEGLLWFDYIYEHEQFPE